MINGEIRRYWRSLLAVIIVVVVMIVVKHYVSSTADGKNGELSEVKVIPITETSIVAEKKYIGYVTPINEVVVYPYISGFISEVLVDGGQKVKVGDELIKIKPEEYIAELNEAIATAESAEADFNYAKNYYERMEKAGVKAVSQTELDNARAKYLAAQGAWKQSEAAIEKARVNLEYTVLKSTIDGVVGAVSLTAGDFVSPQNKLFNIVQTDPMRIVFSISDKDYLAENRHSEMFEGEKISLKLADGSEYQYEGKFAYADNAMDRATNAIAMYADFPNPKKELVDNAYVTVVVSKQYSGVAVAKNLVTLLPEGAEVNVAVGDIVRPHLTEILAEHQDKYIVKNNFKKDEALVIDEVTVGREGQKMKIVEERN